MMDLGLEDWSSNFHEVNNFEHTFFVLNKSNQLKSFYCFGQNEESHINSLETLAGNAGQTQWNNLEWA